MVAQTFEAICDGQVVRPTKPLTLGKTQITTRAIRSNQ